VSFARSSNPVRRCLFNQALAIQAPVVWGVAKPYSLPIALNECGRVAVIQMTCNGAQHCIGCRAEILAIPAEDFRHVKLIAVEAARRIDKGARRGVDLILFRTASRGA
jgi:hypothetical protein